MVRVDKTTHVKYVCNECGYKNPCVLFIDRDCLKPYFCINVNRGLGKWEGQNQVNWKIELNES